MTELPTGTVTFLFTDVEGSTRLLHELGERYAEVLAEHRRVLREAFERHGGAEVDTQGDAFFVAFAKASAAVSAAREAQAALSESGVRVRMGLHTGEPVLTSEGYVGIDVHRAARIAAAGHGRQILVSQSTRDLVGPDGLRDLGEHRLKDMAAPERIYQLGAGEFPPLKSLNNSNLPLPAEPLLGRKKELADVLRLFRDGTRLVTITGPGGIGKTRFALEAAAELVESFRDGVWWVGLAPVRDVKLVLPTITAAVGVRETDDLRPRSLLLLLDNFEQVVGAAQEVAELQRACPDVALLVTSREPLHIGGEREYALAPLPESPAVELFRQRAEAMAADFDAPYADVVELCDRLDRLPLAIELAAARTKVLSADDLLERLDERLPLLVTRRRDVEDRQRTLRATIEWSYELLADEERELFACLSVFAGSFDAAVATDVCNADLDVLESLVDKSLLRRTEDGRFFMLETIREFARGRFALLDAADVVRRRHADWVRALAVEAREELRGERQAEFLRRLSSEHANIRAALEYAIASEDAELALTIAGGLGRFWIFRGHDAEGRRWLDAALALARGVVDELRWRALYWNSIAADGTGDKAAARELVEESLRLAHTIGKQELVGASSIEFARRLLDEGDWSRAEAVLEESAVAEESALQAEETSDQRGLAIIEAMRGELLLAKNDASHAIPRLERSLDIVRRLGDTQLTQSFLAFKALAATRQGDAISARTSLRESLRLTASLGYVHGLAMCAQVAAELALGEGDTASAAELLVRSESVFDAFGVAPSALDAALYRQTQETVRGRVSEDELSSLRAAAAPCEFDECVSYVSQYLDSA